MREDLIQGAITFLQDPSVATSSLDKRIAFLQSKNLTPEEIAAALQRTGVDPSLIPNFGGAPSGFAPPRPAGFGQSYGSGGYFNQVQRQEPAGRDWRDWFVMATVSGSVGYGLYQLAKRYVVPVIAPPTPEALAADKAAIDTAFADAFSLLESLKTDTEALKEAEEKRNTKVDQALDEVETVVQTLKEASKRREEESKRLNDEVRNLKDLIPKALEGQKESQAASLKDLQAELKSLKALLVNRASATTRFTPPPAQPAHFIPPSASVVSAAPSPAPVSTPAPQAEVNGGGQTLGGKPLGSITGGRSAIPAWQLAAQQKAAAAAAASAPTNGEGSSSGDAK
ncbi:peroxisomal membrane protein pex14 [Orbilia ellipsospora]|uniref:Peroxisomal membrane protein PEX14 n=1 Tax=Orbilia ellipsospora TaxID=2528407 RepID=A0AAV9X9K8_9PEZI